MLILLCVCWRCQKATVCKVFHINLKGYVSVLFTASFCCTKVAKKITNLRFLFSEILLELLQRRPPLNLFQL